jgi:hypothetical protein
MLSVAPVEMTGLLFDRKGQAKAKADPSLRSRMTMFGRFKGDDVWVLKHDGAWEAQE